MAGGDYKSCDICCCKTFYDCELQYDFNDYPEHGLRLGAWKVICIECAKTHDVIIIKRQSSEEN